MNSALLQGIKQRYGIVGNYGGLNRALEVALKIAPVDLSVLITGENGTGKEVKVLVFAKGDKVQAALDAGAEYAGAEEYMQKIMSEGWMDFDVVIASPDMMGVVGRLGKVLGPRGLMPNPKAGTVTPDVAKAVKEAKAGKIEYRLDKTNIIHCPIGKASFGVEKLQENFDTLMGAIVKAKPAAAKGQYVKSCVVSATMGPGVKINPARFV